MNVDVKKLQEALVLCGFHPGKIDGVMGPRTKEALTAFQKHNGLTADGIFGPKSAAAISRELGEASGKAMALLPYFAGLK
jgi:peptidoglycan hydrolase-like protein with peptidoglycan-binding domain